MAAAMMSVTSVSVTAMVFFTGIFLVSVMAAFFLVPLSVAAAVLLLIRERIVMLGTLHTRGRETVAEFYAPYARD